MWVERLPTTHKAPGSIPAPQSKTKQKKKKIKILGKYSQAYSLVIFWDNFLTWGQP
jgi:hypothetical protein